MTDRWQQIDQLFTAALDLHPEERAAFLAEACPHDPHLRDAVERLLEAGAEADHFLEEDAGRIVSPLLAEMAERERLQEPDLQGARVGAYRVTRELARGGMGRVYLAERADDTFEQLVAVKVLRRGVDTDDVVRRFMAERQILASLNHPNIAQLLDGGSTEDGRPYLVMEYVEGRPITGYADERRLTIGERLALFDTVGRAVQYAHRHLVVHRDLKPSNILVTADGAVKLLDFGIAKLLDETTEPSWAEVTRTGVRVLTPGHASPEQVRGEPVTTASDVYQLGLLLYELLAGHRAYRVGSASPAEIERVVCQQNPLRPSQAATTEETAEPAAASPPITPAEVAAARRTDPARLRKELRGDLDTIVLKALRKEPDRRYQSVDQLLEDLQRYRSGLPVRATPDSVPYRLRKFVARHRAGVTAAGVIFLLLVGYGVTLSVQAGRIAAERDRAETEAAKAREVKDFVIGLFEVSDPDQAKGETITAREILDAGAARVRSELSGRPGIQAEMLSVIAHVYQELGLYSRAAPLLRETLEVRAALGGERDTAFVRDQMRLADIAWRVNPDSGFALYERALETARRAFGEAHPIVAEAMTDYARRLGPDARAHEMLERAVEVLRSAEGDVREQLARTLMVRAYGQPPEESIPLMQEALEIRRELYGEEHTEMAAALNDLALAYQHTDPETSDSLMERSLAIYRKLLGERHAATLTITSNLAGLRRDRGAYAEAEALYRRVIRVRREIYPDQKVPLAYPMYGLGVSVMAQGRATEAEPILRETLDMLRDALGDDHALVLITQSTLGRCLALQERFPEAEALLLRAYRAVRDGNVPLSAHSKQNMVERIVSLYEAWGQPEQAALYRTELAEIG